MFSLLINEIVKMEMNASFLSSVNNQENNYTKQILDFIAPNIQLLSTSTESSSEIKLYSQFLVVVCTGISTVVDNADIRDHLYQILVNGLGSESPALMILPCLIDLSIIDGEERTKEVNRLLTGLFMNIKLLNVCVKYHELIVIMK